MKINKFKFNSIANFKTIFPPAQLVVAEVVAVDNS